MKKAHPARLAALSSALGLTALLACTSAALAQQPANAKPEAAPVATPVGTAAKAIEPTATAVDVHAATMASPSEEEMVEDEELIYEPLQVGDATQGLLAWQRSGEVASPTSRPIAGNVANRSYERYLKSFEFPIPERMGSTVKSSGSSSGGAPK
jgi:hypothetical protein